MMGSESFGPPGGARYLRRTALPALALVGFTLAGFALFGAVAQAGKDAKQAAKFAADMARSGNWREAKFRWDIVARERPDDPRVLNNLAVAFEALGDHEAARDAYEKARALGPDDERISTNVRRFERFWRSVHGNGEEGAEDRSRPVPQAPPVKLEGKGKPLKVTVQLPVPARLDLEGYDTILVASFITEDNPLLDVNREMVRFIRGEYRKRTELDVLEITPAPAVPEQSADDMVANAEFWKYLGREYDADLVVSGVVGYQRRDHSGFRDVDVVSSVTGQKVRQSRFVEQEKFFFVLDIFFMDGATGELKFRDQLQRAIVFQGTQNDPITAFYELSDSIAGDVLAIVRERTREDTRFIFSR